MLLLSKGKGYVLVYPGYIWPDQSDMQDPLKFVEH